MNRRASALGSGLLVAMTSAALIGTATAAADGGPDRATTAATRRAHLLDSRMPVRIAGLPQVDAAIKAHSDAVLVARLTDAINAQRWYGAIAANLEHARALAVVPRRPSSSGYQGNVLDCIKHRESRGQYNVVNSSSGAAGAYQFMPGTWNTTAASAGRSDLVGVNPSNASAADQDAMAHQLLATQGLGPWGGGCA